LVNGKKEREIMKLERTKNAANNIVWGMINRVVSILLPFALRTILIHEMGVEYAGLGSLFTSILTILNLTELGFSSAITFNMYKPIAENRIDEICSLMALYKKVYHIIGYTILAIGLMILPFLKYLINGSYSTDINIYALYILYLANTVLSYFLFAYKSCIIAAHQRNDILSNIDTILRTMLCVLQAFVLISLKNYYIYVIMNIGYTVIYNLLCSIYATKMYPNYTCRGKVSKDKTAQIKRNIEGLMVGKICMVSRNALDNIFMSAFFGLTAVTIYGNYYYILSAIIGFMNILTVAMSAGIGNSIVSESKEKNYADMHKFTFMYAWIAGWCFVCLINLYQPFMNIWMGEELLFPMSTVILLCLYQYALSLGDIRSLYSNGAGLFWESRYYVLAESMANVILNYVLGKLFGANGIILATLISIVIINFIWGSTIVFRNYFINQKISEFFMRHLKYFIITIFVACIVYVINAALPNSGVSYFMIKMVICIIVPNIMYFLIYRNSVEFREAKLMAKRILVVLFRQKM
jgi:O-antigen/teichoic acid export membrane protein